MLIKKPLSHRFSNIPHIFFIFNPKFYSFKLLQFLFFIYFFFYHRNSSKHRTTFLRQWYILEWLKYIILICIQGKPCLKKVSYLFLSIKNLNQFLDVLARATVRFPFGQYSDWPRKVLALVRRRKGAGPIGGVFRPRILPVGGGNFQNGGAI